MGRIRTTQQAREARAKVRSKRRYAQFQLELRLKVARLHVRNLTRELTPEYRAEREELLVKWKAVAAELEAAGVVTRGPELD